MERFEQLRELPRVIPSTGISEDYANEFTGPLASLEGYNGNWEKYVNFLELLQKKKGKICLLYEERFPSTRYRNVVTEFNRERVQLVDSVAEEVNRLYLEKKLLPQDVERLFRKGMIAVLGEDEFIKRYTSEDGEEEG